jgi:DNA primase
MDFAQQVKSAVDIVNVVGESVRLKKQGPTRYVGLCPFHNEKTPSFSVHEGLQIYKCFGCGKGGDVFNFVMEMQGLTFYEALQWLADRQGMAMPKGRGGAVGDAESRVRDALYCMHEAAQDFFRGQLASPAGTPARAYLEHRGLASDAWERFGLGYAPGGGSRLLAVLQKKGMTAEQMEASGLIAKHQDGSQLYDRFRDRLVFPIHDERGKIIAFGGRALRDDQQPKYLNSPQTVIYKKNAILYNLHRAREFMHRERRAVLVEGYMDVIGVDRAGIGNVIASCGTALTQNHAKRIGRQVETVVVNFDADAAGQNAAERSIEILLQEGLRVRLLTLPDGLDPDDYCRRHGPEAYQRKLDESPSYHDWLADQARARFDISTAEGQSSAIQFVEPKIRLLRDPIERALVARPPDSRPLPALLRPARQPDAGSRRRIRFFRE